jgi:predicted DNA-binding protein
MLTGMMKPYTLWLSTVQIAKLKRLSKRTGLKASELIRRFIDEGLKKK